MSVFADLDAELAETAKRLDRARVAVSMLGDLVHELGDLGFEVDVIQSEVDGALLHVALRIGALVQPVDVDSLPCDLDDPSRYGGPMRADDLIEDCPAPVDLAALAKFDVLTLPPADGFSPALDTRLRDYMAQDMGLGGVAALFRMPRAKVEARWEQMKAALAQVSA